MFTPILIDGGNFAADFDKHAVIVDFGGSMMASLIRVSGSAIAHGAAMGVRYASREAVRSWQEITDIARKSQSITA